jgi:hypothetical protein
MNTTIDKLAGKYQEKFESLAEEVIGLSVKYMETRESGIYSEMHYRLVSDRGQDVPVDKNVTATVQTDTDSMFETLKHVLSVGQRKDVQGRYVRVDVPEDKFGDIAHAVEDSLKNQLKHESSIVWYPHPPESVEGVGARSWLHVTPQRDGSYCFALILEYETGGASLQQDNVARFGMRKDQGYEDLIATRDFGVQLFHDPKSGVEPPEEDPELFKALAAYDASPAGKYAPLGLLTLNHLAATRDYLKKEVENTIEKVSELEDALDNL